jgi:hypothetical protein
LQIDYTSWLIKIGLVNEFGGHKNISLRTKTKLSFDPCIKKENRKRAKCQKSLPGSKPKAEKLFTLAGRKCRNHCDKCAAPHP